MFKDFYAQRGEYVVISAEQASRWSPNPEPPGAEI